MKRIFFMFTLAVTIGSGFFGYSLVNAMAEEESAAAISKYYTSIQIEEGDSLWTIAREFGTNSGKSTEEYIHELKRMNGLEENTIHAGSYLTIVYYAEDSW